MGSITLFKGLDWNDQKLCRNSKQNFFHFPIGKTSIDKEDIWIEPDTIMDEYSILDDQFGAN